MINLLFIHIPKNAGLSIHQALNIKRYPRIKNLDKPITLSGRVSFGHVLYSYMLNSGYITKQWDRNTFKFCFLRNPYDRMVSLYFYSKKEGTVDEKMTFHEFCETIDKRDFNTRSLQTRWLQGVTVDFIGRFEHLQEDIDNLCSRIKAPKVKVPKINTTEHEPWENYYTPKLKKLVKDRYASDFKLWEALDG